MTRYVSASSYQVGVASFAAVDSGRALDIELLSAVRGPQQFGAVVVSEAFRPEGLVSENTWPATDQRTSHEGALYGLIRTSQVFAAETSPRQSVDRGRGPHAMVRVSSRSTVRAWPVARLDRKGEGGKGNVRRASKGVSDASEKG